MLMKMVLSTWTFYMVIIGVQSILLKKVILKRLSFNYLLVFESLMELLRNPKVDDSVESEVMRLYKTDIKKFNEMARKFTLQYIVD